MRRARVDRVTEAPQETHSVGKPINQQTNSGFNAPRLSIGAEDPFDFTIEPRGKAGPRCTPVLSVNRRLRLSTTSGSTSGSIAAGLGQGLVSGNAYDSTNTNYGNTYNPATAGINQYAQPQTPPFNLQQAMSAGTNWTPNIAGGNQ